MIPTKDNIQEKGALFISLLQSFVSFTYPFRVLSKFPNVEIYMKNTERFSSQLRRR